MASRSMNTMQEALQGVLTSLSEMKVMPDADLEWIINLETQIVMKLREPIDRMQAMGITNVPGMPPGAPGGMPPGAPPSPGGMAGLGSPGAPPPMDPSMGMPGGGAGAGVPGVRSDPGMPNPDELRRLVDQG